MPRKAVPDRWVDYNPVHRTIRGTNIIPFKTPLNRPVYQADGSSLHWTPIEVMQAIPNLGIVINLCATVNPYYDPSIFENRGVWYEPLPCRGQVVPSQTVVEDFQSIVEGYSISHRSHGKVIGVHCTHGVNRTGYIVSKYLIDQLQFRPSDALSTFAEGRGYGVERQVYIDALYQ